MKAYPSGASGTVSDKCVLLIYQGRSRHPVVGTNCEEYPFSAKIGTDRGVLSLLTTPTSLSTGVRYSQAAIGPPSPFSPHAFFIFRRKLPTERQNCKRVKNHLYEMQHDSAEKETMLLLLQGLRRCASGSEGRKEGRERGRLSFPGCQHC